MSRSYTRHDDRTNYPDHEDDDLYMDSYGNKSQSSKSFRGVSRKKYDSLKYKTREWYEQTKQYKSKVDDLVDINEELEKEQEILRLKNNELENKLAASLAEADRWKKCSNNLPDADFAEELEAENKNFKKEIRLMKKQQKDMEEKNSGKILRLERDLMLKEGKIQQLEDARKDLKERYHDLKEDLREYQRWSRGSRAPAHE